MTEMYAKEITGLFFHTNSEDVFYTFVYHTLNNMLELEISICRGLYEGGLDYPYEYKYNRMQVGYICDKIDVIKEEHKDIYQAYIFSKLVSVIDSKVLKTKIIWKCMRITDYYFEFENVIDIQSEELKACNELPCNPIADYRKTRMIILSDTELSKQMDIIEAELETLKSDIVYQKKLIDICQYLELDLKLPSNAIDCIGEYL